MALKVFAFLELTKTLSPDRWRSAVDLVRVRSQTFFYQSKHFSALSRLRKNPILRLILGGAAVHRCDNRFVLNAASAAEVTILDRKRLFPQPARTPADCGQNLQSYRVSVSANTDPVGRK
jgi:hypothetical protein